MQQTLSLLVAVVAGAACGGYPARDASVAWRKVPGSGPEPRWGHTAVYDARRDEVLVFGGTGAAGRLGDVWALSLQNESWRRLELQGGPTARYTSGAVIDAARDQMLVFGGDEGKLSDELWALELATGTWRKLPTGPSPRFDVSMTSDGMRAWVYGGFGKSFPQQPGAALDDLWELDFAAQTWRELPKGIVNPSPRTNSAIGLHDGALYVTGGHDELFPTRETWRFLLAEQKWEKLKPTGAPAAGAHFAYATDAQCGVLWLSGGDNVDYHDVAFTESLVLGDAASFSRLEAGAFPPPRRHFVVAFDPAKRRLVLFGGWQGQNALLGDTWILEGVPCP
ncbi:MAG: Kelch repeat-containing protein [Myxococcota bacterium]